MQTEAEVTAQPRATWWRADFTDGQSAVVTGVVVSLEGGELHIVDAELSRLRAVWDLQGTVLDEIQEGVAHLLYAPEPLAMLTIRDPELVSRLRARRVQVKRLPGGRARLRYATLCIVAIAIVGGGFYLSVPGMSRWVAQRVPLTYERRLGGAMLPVLASAYCDSDSAALALGELKEHLDPNHEIEAELRIIRWDMVNAFALPGGIVVLTDGLLQKAQSSDEVAGVLAHELEHVRQRHVMAHLVRASLLTAAWSVAVGDYAGLMLIDPTTAFEIVNLRHSREDEAQADVGGAQRLDAAHISRRGLVEFFERIQADTDKVPEWLSNHPASAQRARDLGLAPSEPGATQPALSTEAFAALRHACPTDAKEGD